MVDACADGAPAVPTVTDTVFQGLACKRLTLPCGDSVLVSAFGAQVLSWVAGGRERLYLSPKAGLAGQSPIRGGVPVCFPQFNQRGPNPSGRLPKHGFARQVVWTWQAAEPGVAGRGATVDQAVSDSGALVLSLPSEAGVKWGWTDAAEVTLLVQLSPGKLLVSLDVALAEQDSTGTVQAPLAFTGALHTYLAMSDVRQASLTGLGGQPEWDAVRDVTGVAPTALSFDGEFDRVYLAAPQPLTLADGAAQLTVSQSASFVQTVVWNPGAALCAQLTDMPTEGWRHMLCVEAAVVNEPVCLLPGQRWQGWQCLSTTSTPQPNNL